MIGLEIQNSNVDQYSIRNNVEISRFPQSIRDNQLEKQVNDILKSIDVNITSKDVIVRVVEKKYCLHTPRNMVKLKSIDKNAVGIPTAKSFVRENLTPVHSELAFNCQKLKKDGEIEKWHTINGIVHIVKNKKFKKLYHLKDLQELFLEYVFHNSDHAE